jgi:hypothetical protein
MNGLFVSSVKDHAVTRFGSGKAIGGVPFPGILIGAERDPEKPDQIRWFPDRIIHIPEPEASVYAREYARALRDGSLRKRTEAEYLDQQARSEEASK